MPVHTAMHVAPIEYADSHMRANNKCPQWTSCVSYTRLGRGVILL